MEIVPFKKSGQSIPSLYISTAPTLSQLKCKNVLLSWNIPFLTFKIANAFLIHIKKEIKMRLASLLLLSTGIMTTSSCVTTLDEYDLGKKPKAYINANIITMDDKNPKAEAIAIKDGKIIAIGSEEKVLASISKDDKVINLRGKTMIPGFVDGHSHFGGVSVQNNVANLLPRPDGDVNSIAELQNELRKFMDDSPIFKKYGTVIGFNYDDSQLVDKRHPTRHDLDKVTTEYPVIVMHQSGHLGVYNTKALEMAKVNSETINPPGGVIRREKDGKTPNGVLEETAHFMVFSECFLSSIWKTSMPCIKIPKRYTLLMVLQLSKTAVQIWERFRG